MKKIELLGMSITTGSYQEFVSSLIVSAKERKSQYTCVANVHMLVEAYKDKQFSKVVANAHVITPDGKPLSWAMQMLYGIKQDRVAGMDLLPDLLNHASQQKLPVYFYGGTTELMDRTTNYLQWHYPQLIVAGYDCPPFRTLTTEEENIIIEKINNSGAAFVFVVLGCPKQEKWMAAMQGKINAVMVGVGGALPVMVGAQKRAPKWMQKYGLEWVFRLSLEPKRLFKRYAVTNSWFVYLLAKEYIILKLSGI